MQSGGRCNKTLTSFDLPFAFSLHLPELIISFLNSSIPPRQSALHVLVGGLRRLSFVLEFCRNGFFDIVGLLSRRTILTMLTWKSGSTLSSVANQISATTHRFRNPLQNREIVKTESSSPPASAVGKDIIKRPATARSSARDPDSGYHK